MKNYKKYLKVGVATLLVVAILPLQSLAENPRAEKIAHMESVRAEVANLRVGTDYVGGEVVVKYKNDSKPFRVEKLHGESVGEAMGRLMRRDDVEYVEPNYMAYADAVPVDQYYPLQWNMTAINMEEAWEMSVIDTEVSWDVTMDTATVTVAVIDTGVAFETASRDRNYLVAPDLSDTCFVAGYDFINNDAYANDDNGHGTHVTGTIAQSTNNGIGVAGVAPGTCIMPVKALDRRGSGSYTAIANAVYFAVDKGADVINMSLGGTASDSTLETAIAYAYENDVTVVAAAGNSNTDVPHYPSSYETVISVGATDYNNDRAPYSNYGLDVDIAAPGGDTSIDRDLDGYVDGILQQTFGRLNDFGYYFFQGTSMASPHVAGAAALLVANGNAITPDDIREALTSTTQVPVTDLGAGLIDVAAALVWTAESVANQAPVAVAGENQTLSAWNGEPQFVTLDGVGSYDPEESLLYYEWSQTSLVEGVLMETSGSQVTMDLEVGEYIFELKVTEIDSEGLFATSSVEVIVLPNQVPEAHAGEDITVTDGDLVTFDASGSTDDGIELIYEWDFGDEETALGSEVSHGYTQISPVGGYIVTLTVTDEAGVLASDTMIVTVTEFVQNEAPIAVIDVFVDGYDVEFNGGSSYDDDGLVVSYEWAFGDSNTSSDMNPLHTYDIAGEYNVTLTVTDNDGETNEAGYLVFVEEPPAFSLGDAVKVTVETIVYEVAGDDVLLGTVRKNSKGFIEADGDNLFMVTIGEQTWWRVNFDRTEVDGWILEQPSLVSVFNR